MFGASGPGCYSAGSQKSQVETGVLLGGLTKIAGRNPFARAAPLAGAADHSDGLRWFEANISPGYDFQLKQDRLSLGLGLTLAAAAAQFRGVESVDRSAGQATTWGARAVIDTDLNVRLSRSLVLNLGTEVGALLRPLTYRSPTLEADAADSRLSGLWLGVQAGIRVDPPGGL